MRKIKVYGIITTLVCMMFALSGCGKEDKLVMVTTEHTYDDTEDATVTDATGTDATFTLADIRKANSGDALLATGNSVSMETVYYDRSGVEVGTETQFLGFSNDGAYLQASIGEDGNTTILDIANGYWYSIRNGVFVVEIYPEPSVADAIINEGHNDFIVALAEDNQTIKNVSEVDGNMVVTTQYTVNDKTYLFEYVLDKNLRVLEWTSYGSNRIKLSYSTVTDNASFVVPDQIVLAGNTMQNDKEETDDTDETKKEEDVNDGYRTVSFLFPQSKGLHYEYEVPATSPIDLKLLEYKAYVDEECTQIWVEQVSDSDGNYPDEVIYLKN